MKHRLLQLQGSILRLSALTSLSRSAKSHIFVKERIKKISVNTQTSWIETEKD
jgi:hypothetical protein